MVIQIRQKAYNLNLYDFGCTPFYVSTNHHFLSVDNIDAFGGWSGYAAALQVVPYGGGSVVAFDAFNARRVNIVVLAVVIVAHVAIAVG